jgi:predicted SprT family Zn-dependent metalloprotease
LGTGSDSDSDTSSDSNSDGAGPREAEEQSEGGPLDMGEMLDVLMEYEPAPRPLAAPISPSSSARPPLEPLPHTPTPLTLTNKTQGGDHEHEEAEARQRRRASMAFKRGRAVRAVELYKSFNETCFDGALPTDLPVTWNKRLLTTAGLTKMRGGGLSRAASIELSVKVLDNDERLQNTLLHEMCHAAAWLLDAQKKPPHGPAFWKWAGIASARSGLLISTCHNYEIHRPFMWLCTNKTCGVEYKRHSKKGIDVDRHRCGKCRSKIEFKGAFNADNTPRKVKAATGFSLFVQEHFKEVKAAKNRLGGTKSHKEVMQELSAMYAMEKDKHKDKENEANEGPL